MQKSRVLPAQWVLWRDQAHDGATNMATDAALLDTVRPDRAIWRWYGWTVPTVSFGRNETVRGRFDAGALASAGLAAVRRPTGGRALLHGREITYSVTVPLAPDIGWRHAYAAVNTLLLGVLHAVGVPASLAGAAPSIRPEGPVCFDAPAEGEIVVDGRKLVGSAVWRQEAAYLQHGSILLHDDQLRLADGCLEAMPPAPPAAELARIAPHVTVDDLAGALRTLLETPGQDVTVTSLAPSAEVPDAIASRRRHFAGPDWLWRR